MKWVLSGVDGSGKSSHARDLMLEARKRGLQVRGIWARRIVLSLPFLALCRALGITQVYKNQNGFRVSEYRFYAYKPLKLVWPWLQFLEWLTFFFHLKMSSLFSSVSVVFDRYTVDAYVDILADVRNPIGMRLLERFFIVSMTKDVSILVLDADECISMERKKDIANFEYLRRRRRAYIGLAQKYGWPVISTADPYLSVHFRIIKMLLEGQTKL